VRLPLDGFSRGDVATELVSDQRSRESTEAVKEETLDMAVLFSVVTGVISIEPVLILANIPTFWQDVSGDSNCLCDTMEVRPALVNALRFGRSACIMQPGLVRARLHLRGGNCRLPLNRKAKIGGLVCSRRRNEE